MPQVAMQEPRPWWLRCRRRYTAVLGDDPNSLISNGGSSIIDPLGRVLAGPVHDEDTFLVADLDLDDIVRSKYDFDVVGHYSRPDIFRFSVDRSVRQPVSFTGEFGRSSSIEGNHPGPEPHLLSPSPPSLAWLAVSDRVADLTCAVARSRSHSSGQALNPPSTFHVVPVMNPDSGLAR